MLLPVLPSLRLYFLIICTGIEKCNGLLSIDFIYTHLNELCRFREFLSFLQVGASLSMFFLFDTLEVLSIWGCSVLVYSLISGNTSLLFHKMFTLLPFYFCLFVVTSNPDTSIPTYKTHISLTFFAWFHFFPFSIGEFFPFHLWVYEFTSQLWPSGCLTISCVLCLKHMCS